MTEAVCAFDGAPSIARCTRCDEAVCARCHGANLAGFCVCRHCRRELEAELRTPWEMARTPTEQLKSFFPTVGAVLRRPNDFFLNKLPFGSVLGPAAFALICLTTGIFFRRVWNWFLVDGYAERLDEAAAELGLSGVDFFTLNLAASPFTAIFGYTLHTAVFHLLARGMGGNAPWHVSARVTAFSCSAALLQIVPPIMGFDIGHILALLWLVFLESHALRGLHGLSLWRGTAVVFAAMFTLFPFMG